MSSSSREGFRQVGREGFVFCGWSRRLGDFAAEGEGFLGGGGFGGRTRGGAIAAGGCHFDAYFELVL